MNGQKNIYYLEKMDVSEEINRIAAHLKQFRKLLKNGKEVGRQMEFIIQELFRETNTLGSKNALPEISQLVVNMKVQLEKLREQSLNLE